MSRRTRILRRTIAALIGLPVLLVLTLVGLAFVWSRWPVEGGPSIPDLRPKVSEEENAWPLLLEAAKQWNSTHDKAAREPVINFPPRAPAANQWDSTYDEAAAESLKQPWQDDPMMAKALRENEGALAKLDEGLTRKALLVPRSESYDDLSPYLKQWRGLARLKVARGYARIRHGNTASGLHDFVDVIRFGHLVENSGGTILHYLAGMSLKTMGYDAMQRALGPPPEMQPKQGHKPRSGWSTRESVTWRQAMKEVRRWEDNRSGLRRSLAEEYHHAMLMLDPAQWRSREDPHGVRLPFWQYQRRKTEVWARRYFAAALEQIDRPWWEQKRVTIPEAEEPQGLGRVKFHLDNPLGRIMLAILLPVLDMVPVASARLEARGAATHVQVALKCYLEAEGHLPHNLSELVPDELSAVPTDPFDGQPLRYDSRRGLVYSVGPNRADDRGREEKKEWETQGDLVFPLRFAR